MMVIYWTDNDQVNKIGRKVGLCKCDQLPQNESKVTALFKSEMFVLQNSVEKELFNSSKHFGVHLLFKSERY